MINIYLKTYLHKIIIIRYVGQCWKKYLRLNEYMNRILNYVLLVKIYKILRKRKDFNTNEYLNKWID